MYQLIELTPLVRDAHQQQNYDTPPESANQFALPNTPLPQTIDTKTQTHELLSWFQAFQCFGLRRGNDNITLCTDNPDLVEGLSNSYLDYSGLIGNLIGCCMITTGLLVDHLGQRTDNPNVRVCTMVTGDACFWSGTTITLTPLAPVIGAAALGATSHAALSSAAMAWIGAMPVSMACSFLCYHCWKPKPESVQLASTTRPIQYRSVFEAKRRRNEAAHMDQDGAPSYEGHAPYETINTNSLN